MTLTRRRRRSPGFIPPQLAALVKQAPDGDGWLHEIKLDGYRRQARLHHGEVASALAELLRRTAIYSGPTRQLAYASTWPLSVAITVIASPLGATKISLLAPTLVIFSVPVQSEFTV